MVRIPLFILLFVNGVSEAIHRLIYSPRPSPMKLIHSYEATRKKGSIEDPIFYSTEEVSCKSLI